MKQKWQEKTRFEKILLIAKMAVSVLVLCAAALQLLHIWPDAFRFTVPMLGVLQLIEAALTWKNNPDQAIRSIIVAMLILAVSCAVFFL